MKKNIAQKIASHSKLGGSSFQMDDGRDILCHIHEHSNENSYHDTRDDLYRFVFEDGSAIIIWNDDSWDVEGKTAWTWESDELPQEHEAT